MTLKNIHNLADTYGSVEFEASQGKHRFTLGDAQ